jgi:hypothetical protein
MYEKNQFSFKHILVFYKHDKFLVFYYSIFFLIELKLIKNNVTKPQDDNYHTFKEI